MNKITIGCNVLIKPTIYDRFPELIDKVLKVDTVSDLTYTCSLQGSKMVYCFNKTSVFYCG